MTLSQMSCLAAQMRAASGSSFGYVSLGERKASPLMRRGSAFFVQRKPKERLRAGYSRRKARARFVTHVLQYLKQLVDPYPFLYQKLIYGNIFAHKMESFIYEPITHRDAL